MSNIFVGAAHLEKFRKDIVVPHLLDHFERVVKVVDVLDVNFEEFGLNNVTRVIALTRGGVLLKATYHINKYLSEALFDIPFPNLGL